MRFYWGSEVEDVPWPDSDWGRALSNFLPDFCQNTGKYVTNVNAQMGCLQWDEDILPVTLGEFAKEECFVTSPFTQYILYGKEELRLLPAIPRWICGGLLDGLGTILKQLDFENVVMLNNWLLTTNFYNDWRSDTPQKLLQTVTERFPDRAVLFRSVNPVTEGRLLSELTSLGFRRLLSRQIYLRPWETEFNRQLKRDRRIYQRSKYELVKEIGDSELERIQELYQMLYIEKYSEHNPKYTVDYIRLLRDSGFMEFRAFRSPEGQIDAFLAFMHREREWGKVMAQPLFGYDTSLPQNLALYRLLSMQALFEGEEHQRLVHLSAGVGPFKRNRGATAHLEFNCVYHAHLPFKRRLPWLILEALLQGLATPIMVKGGY